MKNTVNFKLLWWIYRQYFSLSGAGMHGRADARMQKVGVEQALQEWQPWNWEEFWIWRKIKVFIVPVLSCKLPNLLPPYRVLHEMLGITLENAWCKSISFPLAVLPILWDTKQCPEKLKENKLSLGFLLTVTYDYLLNALKRDFISIVAQSSLILLKKHARIGSE